MRSLFLSAILGLSALGIVSATPSTAEAQWWPRRAYVQTYYAPGYYYAPAYTSYYYSPDTYYVPSTTTTYYSPGTYYYSTPGVSYTRTYYPYGGYWRGDGWYWRRW
jgi:hypothetical protein